MTTTVGTTTYQYDNANRLSSVDGQTYTWDDNGNLLNDGSALYRYDQANRLISTTWSSTTSLFNYNGDGARLKQVVAGVVTTYTQDLAAPLPVVLQAKAGSATTQYIYALSTRPLAENAGSWEYLMPDALGSVRQIADASGNIIRTQDYKPYGSALNSNGSGQSTYGFTGEERDQSGLIFLRARYMQPELGIFLSRDPWPGDQLRSGSMNGYSYVEGNPVLLTDPSGKCPMCWLIIAILAAACSSDSSSQQPTTTPDQILGSTVGLAVVSSENGSPSYEPAIATFLQNGQLFTHDHFKKVDPSKADKVYIYSPKGGNPIAIVNGSDIQQMPGVVHDAYGFYSLTTVNLAAKGVIGANLVDAQNLRIGDQVMAPRWMDSDLTHGLAVFPSKVKEIDSLPDTFLSDG